ncbi:alanine racemase [Agreia pratensis]|uniref:Alanine racemase, N-terminal domain n=1 Tax=Agreia pratensis TaxID=150121 RepID=A0A1X7JSI3_9MICO|nr:alanine racemase C-terminal domain-containing protein [Agreia pratensis]SMG31099.1 Alanine racemase, N-terminal domain [Agreia pratensis]
MSPLDSTIDPTGLGRDAAIDLGVFRANVSILAARAVGGPLVIDMTADAYGHGLVRLAHAAVESGVDILSVRDQGDARMIADAGIGIDVRCWHTSRFSIPPAGSGIAAFGFGMELTDGAPAGIVPVMTVSAPVLSVKRVPEGHGVSYGFVYRTRKETTLALVPLGYADGIPRSATGSGRMAINGRQYPIAGRIAMDQVVLDVGDAPVVPGDRAIAFGPGLEGEPTAADWAECSGSTAGEILARIGRRVPRRYIDREVAR